MIVGGQTTQFIYDGDGILMKKVNLNGTKTIYVGGVYEVDKTSSGMVTRTVTYYPAGGAMCINNVGGSNNVYYILKDHLGSASVVTDSTSPTPQTVSEQRYYPYGETRFTSGTINTDKLFTGQRDVGLGIYRTIPLHGSDMNCARAHCMQKDVSVYLIGRLRNAL